MSMPALTYLSRNGVVTLRTGESVTANKARMRAFVGAAAEGKFKMRTSLSRPSARYSRVSQKRKSAIPRRSPQSALLVSVSHSRAARKLLYSSSKRCNDSARFASSCNAKFSSARTRQ